MQQSVLLNGIKSKVVILLVCSRYRKVNIPGGIIEAGCSISSVTITALSKNLMIDCWPKRKTYTIKRIMLTIVLYTDIYFRCFVYDRILSNARYLAQHD